MSKPAFSTTNYNISLRVNPKFEHQLRLGFAVARRLNKDLMMEIVCTPFNSKWLFVMITVTPRQRTSFTSRTLLRGIHYLMDITHCPLDNISFFFPQ